MKRKPARKAKPTVRKSSRKRRPAASRKTAPSRGKKKASAGKKQSGTPAKTLRGKTTRKSTVRVATSARPAARNLQTRTEKKKSPKTPARIKVSFSRKEKTRFAQLLASLTESLQGQIQFLSSNSLNTEKYDIPRDNGTDDFDRDFALSILSSEQNALFEISEAERRLKDGVYGVCEECNVPIGMSRLEALPFARMCVHCQQKLEERRPRFQPLGTTLNLTGETRSTGEGRTAADDQAE